MQTKASSFEAKCAWMRARQASKRNAFDQAEEPVLKPAKLPAVIKGTPGRRFGYGKRCNILIPESAAYIAGFFDGEGCACIYRRTKPGREAFAGCVSIVNTNVDVLTWIASTTGIGAISHLKRDGTKGRDCAVWQVQAAGAVSFLDQLTPYIRVKREVANLFSDSIGLALTNPDLYRNREWQNHVLRECRRLNRRGRQDHLRMLRNHRRPVVQNTVIG